MDVIITVPHSKCLPLAERRMCDRRAAGAAKILHRQLKSLPLRQFRVHNIVFAQSIRAVGDLNRRVTRDWPWRQRIRSMVNRAINAQRNVLVLDIHSFPNSIESFGLDERTGAVPHVVLLDYERRHCNLQLPHTAVMRADWRNDIILETMRAGGDAILLEFNEDELYTSDKIIKDVANALHQIIVENFAIA